MKNFQFLLYGFIFVVNAWGAQSEGSHSEGSRSHNASQTAPGPQGASLRSVLKSPQAREAQSNLRPAENPAASRHLSAQELIDLRTQLQAQRRETRLERP